MIEGKMVEEPLPPQPPSPPIEDDAEELSRATLKFYNSALDDDAGIDLATMPVHGTRLQQHLDLIERERTLEKVRPVTIIPEPAPVSLDRPKQIGTVSPRTRFLSSELHRREALHAQAKKPDTGGPVRIKEAVAEAFNAVLPPSPRQSRAVAAEMAAQKAEEIQAALAAKAAAKAAREAAIADGTVISPPKAAWQESRGVRERRMFALLQDDLAAADKGLSSLRAELNAFREVKKERQQELALLEAEYEIVTRDHARNCGDAAGLQQKHEELVAQVELADHDAYDVEKSTLTYAFMQERLRMKRPHLERKLAYLRSLHVELQVRLQVQRQAESVAVAYASRMDARIDRAKSAFATQCADHAEQSEGLKSQIFDMGSAKRRAMGGDHAMTQQQLEHLNSVIAEDHAEMQHMLMLKQQRADLKAEVAFAGRSKEVDQKAAPAKIGKALVGSREDSTLGGGEGEAGEIVPRAGESRRMGKREAWQRLCILTGVDHVKGVLEYWEDKQEAKEALQAADERTVEQIADLKRKQTELLNQQLAARDLADASRMAQDQAIDGLERLVVEATGTAKRWARRVDRVEKLISAACTTMLTRSVGMLTHKAIIEQVTPAQRGSLTRLSKQLEEVGNALAKLQQSAGAPSDLPSAEDGAEAGPEAPQGTGPSSASGQLPVGQPAPGTVAGVAAGNLSMAVAHLIGSEGEGSGTGSVSEAELRAAQAALLCSTSEAAVLALISQLKLTPFEAANKQPEFAPQLEQEHAAMANIRTPMLLPRRELMRSDAYARAAALSPPKAPPKAREESLALAADGDTPDAAEAPTAAPADAPVHRPPSPYLEDADMGRFKIATVDPITLAGQAELEAEIRQEILAGGLVRIPAWELKLMDDAEREEFKLREFKVLTEKFGKEEAMRRSSLDLDKKSKPKPPSGPKGGAGRPASGRRPSVQMAPPPAAAPAVATPPAAPESARTASAGPPPEQQTGQGKSKPARGTGAARSGALSARPRGRVGVAAARPHTAASRVPIAPTPSGTMRRK